MAFSLFSFLFMLIIVSTSLVYCFSRHSPGNLHSTRQVWHGRCHSPVSVVTKYQGQAKNKYRWTILFRKSILSFLSSSAKRRSISSEEMSTLKSRCRLNISRFLACWLYKKVARLSVSSVMSFPSAATLSFELGINETLFFYFIFSSPCAMEPSTRALAKNKACSLYGTHQRSQPIGRITTSKEMRRYNQSLLYYYKLKTAIQKQQTGNN